MGFKKSLSKEYILLSRYVFKSPSHHNFSSSVSSALGKRRFTLSFSFYIFLSLFRLDFNEGFSGLQRESRGHYQYSPRLFYGKSQAHHSGEYLKSNMLICGWHDIRRCMQMAAAPKRGSIVDTYRSVDVLCTKCQTKLFKYKKKNGTKSKLVKMYIERIVNDPFDLLLNNKSETTFTTSSESNSESKSSPSLSLIKNENQKTKKIFKNNTIENSTTIGSPPLSDANLSISCSCPKCGTKFGRPSFIKGLPAIAIVGGKLRMK